MRRLVTVSVLGWIVLVAGSGRHARAQMAGGGALPTSTPLPMATDLKKVRVGSWAEYRLSDGQTSMTVRMALVGRGPEGADIETQISGGPMAALGASTMRMTLVPGANEARPTHHMMQIAANDPMLLPDMGANGQVLKRPDPKARVGVESLTVPAGVFPRAEHYREAGPGGETLEFWVSPDVPPFGVVKVSSLLAGRPQTMELVARGDGAKRRITKKAQPYDPAALMRMLQAGMSPAAGTGTAAPTAKSGAPGPGSTAAAHPSKAGGAGAGVTPAPAGTAGPKAKRKAVGK